MTYQVAYLLPKGREDDKNPPLFTEAYQDKQADILSIAYHLLIISLSRGTKGYAYHDKQNQFARGSLRINLASGSAGAPLHIVVGQ